VRCQKPGYGAKRRAPGTARGQPYHFGDGRRPLGVRWPKWRARRRTADFAALPSSRTSGAVASRLDRESAGPGLARRAGPRATMQITPTALRKRRRMNKAPAISPAPSTKVQAPRARGCTTYRLHAVGLCFTFPGGSAARDDRAAVAVLAANITGSLQKLGGRSNYIHPDELPASANCQHPQEKQALTWTRDYQRWGAESYQTL